MALQKWGQQVAGASREQLGVAAVAVTVVLGGGFFLLGSGGRQEPVANTLTIPAKTFASPAAPEPSPAPIASPTPKKNGIIVYVTGAVKRPGVYTLPADARLYHAVRAAGGFKANAVQDALNLADRAQDGDQLCVPARTKAGTKPQATALTPSKTAPRFAPALIRKASHPVTVALPPVQAEVGTPPEVTMLPEAPAPPARVLGTPASVVASLPTAATDAASIAPEPDALTAPGASTTTRRNGTKPKATTKTSEKFKSPGDGIVHLNTATDAELQQLSRCGPAMSAKIVAYRTKIGRFTDIKQLMDVKGVGEKTFSKWQPFLAL